MHCPCENLTLFQFYFVNALFALGMVFGLLGLTIFLRWEYNLFGDPVGPLIFAVMFLFGDLLQKLLRWLADIQVMVHCTLNMLRRSPNAVRIT